MEIFGSFFALSLLLGISSASTDGICQNINFAINKNVVPDHALEGHVFKNLTVDKVTHFHVVPRGLSLYFYELRTQQRKKQL